MNPEVKADWVAALRSGEYPQGRGYLRSKGKFCCLGVLCDLAVKAGVVEAREPLYEFQPFAYGETGDQSLPPVEVREWAGLPSNNPDLQIPLYGAMPMAAANDDLDMPFSLLAELIEQQL